MKPIWLQYYGLIWVTKRGYLITTAIAAAIALGFFLIVGNMGLLPPFPGSGQPAPQWLEPGFFAWFYQNFWWIILALLALETVDILTVMYKFRQKEAEQIASNAESSVRR